MNSAIPYAGTTAWPNLKENLISNSPLPFELETNSSVQLLRADTEASIGLPCGFLGSYRCWEVAGSALQLSRPLLRDISEVLNQHSEYLHSVSILFSINFGLFMIGSNEHNAHPTLVLSCERELKRIRCLNIVRKSGILRHHPSVLLGSSSHFPISTPQIQPRDTSIAADCEFVFFSPPGTNDVCGRPIHVMERTIPGNSCPTSIRQKATIGGFLRLWTNEEEESYCGLTVAHAFIDEPLTPTDVSRADFAFEGQTPQVVDGLGDTAIHDG
jgi:hypothetical protein